MSIRELDELELMEVSGGWRTLATTALRDAFISDVARAALDSLYSGASAAARWLVNAAPGGADETTWNNVGYAGMSA